MPLALLACGAEHTGAREPDAPALAFQDRPEDGPLRGRTECDGSNCNYCVADVRAQFAALTARSSLSAWPSGEINYTGSTYAPSNLSPSSAYGDGSVFVQSNHVQGIVHAGDQYAYTFDHETDGTLSIASSATHELAALHRTEDNHPSGVFGIGSWVGVVSGRTHVEFYDARDPVAGPARRDLPSDNEDVQPGQGASMVALANGGYLTMVTQKKSDGMWVYWNILGGSSENSPPTEAGGDDEFLGGAVESEISEKEWQNSSLLTECDTGYVYAVHVTGSDALDVVFNTAGSGFWKLTQIYMDGGKPALHSAGIGMRAVDQIQDRCWARGGASTYGDQDGRLHFLCAAREPPMNVTDYARDGRKPLPGGNPGSGDTLLAGELLLPDQSLTSADGRYRLSYQLDGNLVLYRASDNKPLWASKTPTGVLGEVLMQHDGNLVIYGAPFNDVVWAAGSQKHSGSRLVIQNDGNAVIYNPKNKPVWATDTRQ